MSHRIFCVWMILNPVDKSIMSLVWEWIIFDSHFYHKHMHICMYMCVCELVNAFIVWIGLQLKTRFMTKNESYMIFYGFWVFVFFSFSSCFGVGCFCWCKLACWLLLAFFCVCFVSSIDDLWMIFVCVFIVSKCQWVLETIFSS